MKIFLKLKKLIQKTVAKNLLLLLSLLFVFYLFVSLKKFETDENKKEQFVNSASVKSHVTLKPLCACRDDLFLINHSNDYFQFNNVFFSLKDNFQIPSSVLNERSEVFNKPNFKCDLYNELRRGPRQKVIGYSLYGKQYGYYDDLQRAVGQALSLFPDWNVRVYYDNTINTSVICEIECKFKNVDFCDVKRMPWLEKDLRGEVDLSEVHGMMWRWFPIADDFVDFFSSRDSDSTLIQREKDSVNAWLNSNKLFHIMRDHPFHNIPILGGLWGHANLRNRNSGYEVFNRIVKTSSVKIYNPNRLNLKNNDQNFLGEQVWPLAQKNATIHDSYHCRSFGGEPFPTQRDPNLYCFVSCFHPCCDSIYNQTHRMDECPEVCRPANHKDWIRC